MILKIRIKLLTIFLMLKRPLQCSYQIQHQTVKSVLKLNISSSIISGSNWENFIEIQHSLHVCL